MDCNLRDGASLYKYCLYVFEKLLKPMVFSPFKNSLDIRFLGVQETFYV